MTATNLFITTGFHSGMITFSIHPQAAYRPRDIAKQGESVRSGNQRIARWVAGFGAFPLVSALGCIDLITRRSLVQIQPPPLHGNPATAGFPTF